MTKTTCLTDMFTEEGHNYFYKHLCNNFELQYYLKKPIQNVYVQFISIYRLSSHQLEIERGSVADFIISIEMLEFVNFVHYHRLKMSIIVF